MELGASQHLSKEHMLSAQDFAGVTCKDDSTAGAKKMNAGPGRAGACTYWRHVNPKNTKK